MLNWFIQQKMIIMSKTEFENMHSKTKNYKKCYAWRVHPGFGYVCYDMCDEDKRKMCIEDFKKDKLKTPLSNFFKR